MGMFERWSYANLGQWHYVLGYLYVLLTHNWPLLLSAGLCLWWGWRLYVTPTRGRVCLFFGALLLGITYEYNKHIAPTLLASLDMVLYREAGWLNGLARLIVGPVAKLLLFGAMAFLLARGLWREVALARHVAPTAAYAGQRPRRHPEDRR